jgi:hypothetical protein
MHEAQLAMQVGHVHELVIAMQGHVAQLQAQDAGHVQDKQALKDEIALLKTQHKAEQRAVGELLKTRSKGVVHAAQDSTCQTETHGVSTSVDSHPASMPNRTFQELQVCFAACRCVLNEVRLDGRACLRTA